MVKAEIRPPSSSSPEPAASAIKHDATERAAEPTLPITDAFPHARLWRAGISLLGTPWTAPRCPGIPLVPSAACVALDVALGTRLCSPGLCRTHGNRCCALGGIGAGLETSLVKETSGLATRWANIATGKRPNPNICIFLGINGFFPLCTGPLDKAGLNFELFWDPPPQEMNRHSIF